MRCAVVGAGAWGTALADLLARNGNSVTIWAFEPDVADAINRGEGNPRYLKDQPLAPGIKASSSLPESLEGAGLVVFSTPSQVLRAVVRNVKGAIPHVPLVVASKGIERGTLALMTTVVAEELGPENVVALSGPSFAAEVVRCQPTAVVIASDSAAAAETTQKAFNSPYFRTYLQHDVTGVELGGALKNVMAVATGIADGLGLGFNARAALITRGLAEMTRLGASLGADPATFAGLAGLGDLVLTCTGTLSRNREVGVEVGRGRPLADVLQERDTVAEGVETAASALELASREGVVMPIVEAVNRVLFHGQAPREGMAALMSRELRAEVD